MTDSSMFAGHSVTFREDGHWGEGVSEKGPQKCNRVPTAKSFNGKERSHSFLDLKGNLEVM